MNNSEKKKIIKNLVKNLYVNNKHKLTNVTTKGKRLQKQYGGVFKGRRRQRGGVFKGKRRQRGGFLSAILKQIGLGQRGGIVAPRSRQHLPRYNLNEQYSMY